MQRSDRVIGSFSTTVAGRQDGEIRRAETAQLGGESGSNVWRGATR